MNESNLDRGVIFVLRILIGWTFLYAGFWQIRDNYDTAGFLNHVVTFHDFFSLFAKPAVLPYTDFLVKWAICSSAYRWSRGFWCASAGRLASC